MSAAAEDVAGTARSGAAGRRARLRAQTRDEALASARRLLVAEGPAAVSLRAIARDMGVTAPALYRYFPSHEDLVSALVGVCYDDLVGELSAARDRQPPGDVGRRLVAASRRVRSWGLEHPREMELLFGAPIPGRECSFDKPEHQAAARFGNVFLDLFARLWEVAPFPVRDASEIDPGLRQELRTYLPEGSAMPLGAVEVFLRCWMRLYGAVTMEVFGHLHFAVVDGGPLFEVELRSMGEMLGLDPDASLVAEAR